MLLSDSDVGADVAGEVDYRASQFRHRRRTGVER